MLLELKKGNIFNSKAQTVVNTVNTVGVMGKGIALVYKLRYPMMYNQYIKHCKSGRIAPGKLWLYKGERGAPWVLNFPTKNHWKNPSKIEYLKLGLEKFIETYEEQGIQSVAFPLLGTHNGGLNKDEVIEIMISYLNRCEIPIEIYEYDPTSPDDLFESFLNKWHKTDLSEIKNVTGLRADRIRLINETLKNPEVYSMINLVSTKGIGLRTIEKCFNFVMHKNIQTNLFE